MHRIFLRSSLVAGIVLLTAFAAHATPKIAADKQIFDFGSIPQGKKLTHAFIIRNAGDAPLTIEQVTTSCGCTAAASSQRTLPPGATSEIKATFDSTNFRGSVHKTVQVRSNDPKTPVYIFTLQGTVIEQIVVAPLQLNAGTVKAGGRHELTITLENHGDKVLNINAVKSPSPQIQATIKKSRLKPGESTTIKVSISPRNEDRLVSGYLTISTDNPAKPEITVPVFASVTK